MPPFLHSLAQNWKLKLLALALAVLLWVVVSAEQVTSNWIPVPLQVRVLDPEYQLVESSVSQQVRVRFSGPGRELWDLAIRRPPLILTIEDVDDTVQDFNVQPSMVQVPGQLSVNPQDVRPGTVTLTFQRVESRSVPVRVRVASGPGNGWMLLDSLEVRPDWVRISGLADDLADVRSISTMPISLHPSDSIFNWAVPLDTSGLGGVRLSANRVRVSGQLDRVMGRAFSDVPISTGVGVFIRPTSTEVQVWGPRTRLSDLDTDDFRVVIAIDSIPDRVPPEGVLVPLRVERLRPGLQVALEPSAVRLLPGRMYLDTVPVPRAAQPQPADSTPAAERIR